MDPALPLNQPPSPQHQSGMFTQSRSNNNLRFICKIKPTPGPPQGSSNEDYLDDTDCESITVIVPAQCSVYQLRLRICMQVGNPAILTSLVFSDEVCFKLFSVSSMFDLLHYVTISPEIGPKGRFS